MDFAITIVAAILIVVGLTAVFYADQTPLSQTTLNPKGIGRSLTEKTVIAGIGFLAIVIALYIIGFWGAWAT